MRSVGKMVIFDKASEGHPVLSKRWSVGQRAADKLTRIAGSWIFIFGFLTFVIIWMIVNILVLIYRWDPYPFILLNLILSCLAALQAPIILMSQNRENERDRLRSMYDYQVDRKAEREIRDMKKELVEIKRMISKLK